jgi:hypothetical protein
MLASMEPIWLFPPPDLGEAAPAYEQAAARALGPDGRDPVAWFESLVAAGPAGAVAWAVAGPERAREVWGEQARLGMAAVDARLGHHHAVADRFTLGAGVSSLAQRAWLAGDERLGRRADLLACELAVGGWPGQERLDRPDLVLLLDPAGAHALAHAGSRVRLGMIRDFPVASPDGGGSWKRPGTVDRLLDHVDRQAHLAGPLVQAVARLLRTLVHPAMGPPWPPGAASQAQRRLAAHTCRDAGSWALGLPWLLDTVRCFPGPLAPTRRG